MQRMQNFAVSLINDLLTGRNLDGSSKKEDLIKLIAKDFVKYSNKFYRGLEITSNANEVIINPSPSVKKPFEVNFSQQNRTPSADKGMTLSNYFAYKLDSQIPIYKNPEAKIQTPTVMEEESKASERSSNGKGLNQSNVVNKNLFLWAYTTEVEICYGPMSSWYAYLLLREIRNFPLSSQETPFKNLLLQDSEDDVYYNPNFFYDVLCRVYSSYHLLFLNSIAKSVLSEKKRTYSDLDKPELNEYEIIGAVIKKVTSEFLIKSSKEKYFSEEGVFNISQALFKNPNNSSGGRKLLKSKKFKNRYETQREEKTFGISLKRLKN